MTAYSAANWYWLVAGSSTQAWSSARAAYVPAADPAFAAWLSTGGTATAIDSEADLAAVLAAQYPAGWPPVASATITSSAYFGRFTPDETNAIHSAALAQPVSAESLSLFNFLLLAAAAASVTLTDPVVVGGHAGLVSLGLLTPARSAAILTP